MKIRGAKSPDLVPGMEMKRIPSQIPQTRTLCRPITPLQPESEASVKISRDGTNRRKEVVFSKNLRSVKGSKASLKEAVTGMERSLLDVEVKVFIQMITGIRKSLPYWSIGLLLIDTET